MSTVLLAGLVGLVVGYIFRPLIDSGLRKLFRQND